MLSPIDQAYARLGMLEFALEIIFGIHLGSIHIEDAQAIKDHFLDRLRSPVLDDTGELSHTKEQKEAEINALCIKLGEHFIEKVESREYDIRSQLAIRAGTKAIEAMLHPPRRE